MVDLEVLREFLSEVLICERVDEKTLKITWSDVGDLNLNEGVTTLHGYLTMRGWTATVRCQTYFKPDRTKQEKEWLRGFNLEEVDEGQNQFLVLKVKLSEEDDGGLIYLLDAFFDEAAEMQ